jgi:hypothetical protein
MDVPPPLDPIPVEVLKRLGTSRESVGRLTRKAGEAERALGIYGVSVTAGIPRGSAGESLRTDVEKCFPVHDTPTRSDPLHRTVELPKPLTEQAAAAFNGLFGRAGENE